MKKVKFLFWAAVTIVFIMTCKAPEFENLIMREWWPEDNDDLTGDAATEVPDIIKANPIVNWPSNLTAVLGQTLSEIKLPSNGTSAPSGTFTWTRPADPVGSHGVQTHNMTFTPDDTLNYNTLKNYVAVTVTLVKMVYIPAGSFIMGSSDIEDNNAYPPHQVTLTSGFYMSECPITQEQYKAVTGINPSYYNGRFKRGPVGGENQVKRPVEMVTWFDALEFCNKLSEMEGLQTVYAISARTPAAGYPITDAVVTADLSKNGYRLPTEAQWEYACRAGTTTAYNTGNTISDDTGWYYANSELKTHEVGLKPPNAWGLYDMHGNVFEWCWDLYDDYPAGPVTDPVGVSPGTEGVVRGGNSAYQIESLRSATSFLMLTSTRSPDIGIRIVRP